MMKFVVTEDLKFDLKIKSKKNLESNKPYEILYLKKSPVKEKKHSIKHIYTVPSINQMLNKKSENELKRMVEIF